jgi:ubiquinone/menaquinone biosynthesis C-methylase UbiE
VNVSEWIEKELQVEVCDSTKFMYDEMESQSAQSLPIIYQPFDMNSRAHWRERGSLFDYLFSTDGEGKKMLDLGPGDGWPSLIIAPFVDEVIGVDASKKRVEVCRENAEKMKIKNTDFVYVEPGKNLPFGDESFDGIMAASSVEQTPDPKFTIEEIFRVLKTGGRFRINYEALSQYKKKREKEVFIDSVDNTRSVITIYDRRVDEEKAIMYKIFFSQSSAEVLKILYNASKEVTFDALTLPVLEKLRSSVVAVRKCILTHPSGRTFARWMKDIGFSEINPTHSGSLFAGQLFDALEKNKRPRDINELDNILRPNIEKVVRMTAKLELDPMITAIK